MGSSSGIERDVYIYSTPTSYIADFKVESPLDTQNYKDGHLNIDLDVVQATSSSKKKSKKAEAPSTISYKLLDAKSNVVASASAPVSEKVNFQSILKDVNAWSAESPYIYTLVMDYADAAGNITETIGCNVGFRISEIKNKQLHVNGKPILIKGVNRHEHSDLGRTVSYDLMVKDIQLMKEANMNTVRNSHYPTDPMFYHLCDVYGLYMIDEANIESHGMGYGPASLAKDTTWLAAPLDRTARTSSKSKPPPAVPLYSLGNAPGDGVISQPPYKFLPWVAPSRPLPYERTHTS